MIFKARKERGSLSLHRHPRCSVTSLPPYKETRDEWTSHTDVRISQYLLLWCPVRKHRHVPAKLSLNFGVMNTRRGQEQTPGISKCRKISTPPTPVSQRAGSAVAAFPQAGFVTPPHSQGSAQQPFCFKSQVFPDSGREAPGLPRIWITSPTHDLAMYVLKHAQKSSRIPSQNQHPVLC